MDKENEESAVDETSCRTITELILYKMDRTFAVVGIVVIGVLSITVGKEMPTSAIQITTAAITALATYVGVKAGVK